MSKRNWKKQPSIPTHSSPVKQLRAAIYARVSTTDQDCTMQLHELRDYCERRKWEVAGEYVDKTSGAVSSRPALDKLKADARARRFDAVIVWKLDRWGRSLIDCINGVRELTSLGIRWIAVTQGLDTDESNPASRLMLNLMFSFAEFERELIQERILAGMAQQRRNIALGRYGKDIHSRTGKDMLPGRPRRIFRRDVAKQLREQGYSYRQIARELDVPYGTVFDALGGRKEKPAGKAA